MNAELKNLPIDQIMPHPQNPRLVIREDVVDSITKELKRDRVFSQEYAIRVRPVNSHYQIVSGHHRHEAAKRAGLLEVPCWVREMDDETAFMDLVRSNAQGELSPLEIGMHALESIQLQQGKANGGLAAYADMIGRSKSAITECRQAAEVFKAFNLFDRSNKLKEKISFAELLTKANHLVAIHKAPESCWPLLVSIMIEKDWGKRDVKDIVQKVREYVISDKWQAIFLPLDKVIARGLIREFSASTVKNIIEEAERIEQRIKTYTVNHDAFIADFHAWLQSGIEDYSWDSRKIIQYGKELQAKLESAEREDRERWLLGNWKDHLATLKNKSIAVLLTDPPYGLDYQSGRRESKHEKIANDTPDAAIAIIAEMVAAMLPKLAADSHVLIFCHWRIEREIMSVLEGHGLTVKGSLIWVKNNRGMGDLKGTFAPQHERIIHAVCGSPILYDRKPDVFIADRIPTTQHPTEKPVALLQELIEATTAKSELVCDPFGGVASTLVAAKQCGRNFWGCEIVEEYHAIGANRLR